MNPSKQTAFATDKEDVADPISFWKQQLDNSALLEMPTDFPRSSAGAAQIDHVPFLLPIEKLQGLKQLSRQCSSSLFTTLLAAYNTLLFKYTKQDEVVVGVPTIENLFGEGGELMNVKHNTKVFRTNLSAATHFEDLVKRVHQVVLIGNKYRAVPFEKLEESARLDFGINYTGLYNAIFSFSDTWLGSNKFNDWVSNVCIPEKSRSAIELALYTEETKDGLKGIWTYNPAMFERQTIERLAGHFDVLLDAIILNSEQTIGELSLLTARERFKLTNVWNISKVDYPAGKCVFELFEEQVIKTPDAPALVFEGSMMTYAVLNERANRIAHYLRSKGVGEKTLVPLFVGRSSEMIVGLLAILKAGAAYVPIDPNYPSERVAYMLEDTDATIVICNNESKPLLSAFVKIESIVLGGEEIEIANLPSTNPDIKISTRNLAYVIYTSGSTGKPKGVMVEHRSLVDHCFGVIESAGLNDCRSFALFSPLVFDAGHSIIHSSFLLGSCLHVLSEDVILSSEKIKTYLENNVIDCIKIVPSLWLSYANLQSVILAKKVMIFGGEAFHLGVLSYLKKQHYTGNVYNHYGPTEITIGKCIHHVDINRNYRSVPIGKPFSNTQLYVLDENLQLVPIGVEGELYVAGDGVARGYLKQPNVTIEKFIPDPFSADTDSRMYRTGDKVKWLADGNLEYLGRADEQVKILGHRIELGEIEDAILKSDLVKQAVVLAVADKSGNKRLAAYVVHDGTFNKQAISEHLSKCLPEYMIPLVWVELENLPVTKNGKINKKALEGLEEVKKTYRGPKDAIQSELMVIWQEVLKTDKIDIDDDFFELGGNSIIAALLFTKIKRRFHKNFPLAAIFRMRTIALLSEALRDTNESSSFLSSLVTLQPNGTKTPVFSIHAGLGNVLFYEALSKQLGNDQPFYALQARGLTGVERPFTQMEQMASHYISEIRKVQPEGPYYIAGYCLGARIAVEIAQQLIREGQKIALLANFNGISQISASPKAVGQNHDKESLKRRVLSFSRNIKRDALFSLRKSTHFVTRIPYRLMYKINGAVYDVLFKYKKVPLIVAKLKVIKSFRMLQNGYTLKDYPGTMVIFRSPDIFMDPNLGWKNIIKGGIKTVDIPGTHKTRRDIMNEPHVQFLAEQLKGFLDKG